MDTFIAEEQAQTLLDDARTFYDMTVEYFRRSPVA